MAKKFPKLVLLSLFFSMSGQLGTLAATPLKLVAVKMADKTAATTLLNMTEYIAGQSNPPLKFSQKPVSRAYYELENFPGYCSLSVIRSQSTEDKFNWILPSVVIRFSIVKRQNDPTIFNPISSVIAVSDGSIMSKKIEKASLVSTSAKSRQDIINLMLKSDIHFWGDADRVIESIEKQRMGLSFVVAKRLPSIDMWIACSKRTDQGTMGALKILWLEAQKSQQFQKLYNQLFQVFLR
ncbi:MAG: hypothetical protein V7750_11310 [Sneathiella sp.]